MKVVVAESAGFCWGVKRAVEKARALAAKSGMPVYTDGPLIHNKQMLARLAEEGIKAADNPETLSNCVLLIRAHGIPPSRKAALEKLPVRLEDATCPDVARIHRIIRERVAAGETVLVFGDAGHPEVIGLVGCAGVEALVIRRPEEVSELPPPRRRYCLVSQSTQFPRSFDRIAASVLARFPDSAIIDTICRSTRRRQEELFEMAPEVDAFVIVGDPHSANTLRLVEIARELKPAFHVRTADDVAAAEFSGLRTVGLSAGASTPSFVLEEVRKKLESIPTVDR